MKHALTEVVSNRWYLPDSCSELYFVHNFICIMHLKSYTGAHFLFPKINGMPKAK